VTEASTASAAPADAVPQPVSALSTGGAPLSDSRGASASVRARIRGRAGAAILVVLGAAALIGVVESQRTAPDAGSLTNRLTTAADRGAAVHREASIDSIDDDARRALGSGSLDGGSPVDGDWPNLFGPTHDSTIRGSAARIVPWGERGPEKVWEVACGTGYSSPIVVAGRVVLLHRVGDEEVVSCLEAATGAPVWEQRYPTTFVCGSHYTHGPYSTPACDGSAVFTLGAQGQLHCWSLSDGALRWSRRLREEFDVPPDIFGVGHSPLLWGDRLILNVGGRVPDSGIIAFDRDHGDIVWRSTSAGAAFATPVPARILGRDRLFILTRQGLSLLQPDTGAERWQLPFEPKIPDSANAVSPCVAGNVVLVSAWGVGTKALRIDREGDYVEIWDSRRILTSQYTPLLTVDGCVIGVHALDDSLRCVELETGALRWRWKSPLGNCKPIRVADQLVLFGEYGHLGLIACDVERLVVESVTAEGLFGGQERCYSAPACAAGRLYVRSESSLLCLDLGGAAATSRDGPDQEAVQNAVR